jgi:hypothetical protein
MPSVSQKQHNFMEAAAHNPEFAAKHHIGQDVAKEFVAADKTAGKKYSNESIIQQPMAGVRIDGYVQPTGAPPFKVF